MSRQLITSALPYINGVKHLGNLVGSMLPADVYSRFLRLRGDDVLFVCATDEHGTPAELAALEEGLDVAEYCRQQHAIQAALGEAFDLSWDVFGRSSSPQNRDLTQHFARRLDEQGFIEERTTEQVYSIDDGRFLPDRYIIGTCPHCGYPAARGDQCENCTRLLDPTDLIEPRSAISGSTNLEVRPTTHLFLRPSLLAGEVRAWLDTKKDWPVLTTSIAYKWLDEGLGRPRPGLPILEVVVVRRRRRDLHAVHGQGQRPVPHRRVPRHDHRVARAVEARGLHQELQLAQLLRRQVLDQPGRRRLHGRRRGAAPSRLLALLPHGERARVGRQQLHVGGLRGRGQQGSRRHVRQLRQPLSDIHESQRRRRGARRRWSR